MKKITSRIKADSEFDQKAKKFFWRKRGLSQEEGGGSVKKVNRELTAKLGESKSRRMENLLEEADTSKIREAVSGLTSITEDIQSKTEQVKGS